ncbi:MAG: radical SAM protein [Gemmatimonadota bacterium]|nr:radical SAM protein [Gemmatimonadota bacterium]
MASLVNIVRHLQTGARNALTPNYVEISVVGHCNFSCVQCHQAHHMREDVNLNHAKGASLLPSDMVLRLLDELKDLDIETVELCGRGEPTLHPDLDQFIRRVKKNGFKGNLVTNGSRISDTLIASIQETYFDEVAVSIYGLDNTSFREIARPHGVASLDDILRNMERMKCAAPSTRITATLLIQAQWFDRLETLVPLMSRMPADRFEFVVTRGYEDGHMIESAERDANEQAGLTQARERLLEKGIAIPAPLDEFLLRRIACSTTDTIQSTYSRIPCYAGHWALFVADDATVRPCSNSNWVLGNLREQKLAEIWRSGSYDDFRSRAGTHILATRTPLPKSYCSHCGWSRFQEQLHGAVIGENNSFSLKNPF